MKRILFLDDNPARQRWARRELAFRNVLLVIDTATRAIDALAAGDFDEVYLDHDLGEETDVDPGRKDCGFEVVRWIAANRPMIGRVIVHTLSGHGDAMVEALRAAGYDAEHIGFLRLASGRLGEETTL